MNNFDRSYVDFTSRSKISLKQPSSFRSEILKGLSLKNKKIPCKYLYDENGIKIFNEISKLEEYYQTRTELFILKNYAKEILSKTNNKNSLIYLGGCSALKAEPLLQAGKQIKYYFPVDISKKHLVKNSKKVAKKYKYMQVKPVVYDFSENVEFPNIVNGKGNILFFPGSTIGNFSEKKAKGLLRSLAKISNREVDLVIGIDLKKDKTVLENAYNDKKGVTEKFTLNLLKRINRELAGNIDTNHFRHVAKYNEKRGCIEVFIESLKDQSIKISNRKFRIKKSEKIHIEDCYKYDENQFKKIAALSGWKKIKSWKDPNKNFSVFLLRS